MIEYRLFRFLHRSQQYSKMRSNTSDWVGLNDRQSCLFVHTIWWYLLTALQPLLNLCMLLCYYKLLILHYKTPVFVHVILQPTNQVYPWWNPWNPLRVGVFCGSQILYPYLYPWDPYPETRAGPKTRANHYRLLVWHLLIYLWQSVTNYHKSLITWSG